MRISLIEVLLASGVLVGWSPTYACGQELPARATAIVPKLSLAIPAHEDSLWQITFVRDMAVDAKGNIFVFENSDFTVRMFDERGKPLRRFGGRGGGPGEFTQSGRISIHRDSLWILEAFTNRVSAFSIDKRGSRSFRVPPGRDELQVAGIATDGLIVGMRSSANAAFGMSGKAGVTYAHTDMNGKTLHRLIGEQAAGRGLVVHTTTTVSGKPKVTGRMHGGQPFVDHARVVPTSDGKHLLLVSPARRMSNDQGAIDMMLVGLRGDTVWRRTLRYAPRVVTSAELTEVIDSLARPRRVGGVTMGLDRRMLLDSLHRASHWPAVTDVISGIDGTIWLRQGGPTTSHSFYWRLSPKGEFEALVQMPIGFRLVEASRTQLWGWRLDRDELPVIERYSM